MLRRLWKVGRLVLDTHRHTKGHGRIGVGYAKEGWHANHLWWRFYWVHRKR